MEKQIVSRAPGRVCLFGDHQDYLGLPVIAAAINRHITFSAEKNNSYFFNLYQKDINEERKIDITDPFENLGKRDYYGSALKVLKRYGCLPTQGYDITISGNIPINAGSSSSSAIVVAWTNLLLELFGSNFKTSPKTLAQLAYEIEVKEHGEPGGMMDHFSISLGGVVFIDTRGDYPTQQLLSKLPGLVLGDSKTPKGTIGLLSRIKTNVNSSIEAVKDVYKDFQLIDAEIQDINKFGSALSDELLPYFSAALENHHYTKQAVKALKQENVNFEYIGNLLTDHHKVLKDKLKITVPKIDTMIEAVLNVGALGAKINGSGGGGSIVVLAPGKEKEVVEALEKVGAEAWAIDVDDGAKIV